MFPRTDRDAVAHLVPEPPNRRHAIASTPEGHGQQGRIRVHDADSPPTRQRAGPSVGAGRTARRVRDARDNCGIENSNNAPQVRRFDETARADQQAGCTGARVVRHAPDKRHMLI